MMNRKLAATASLLLISALVQPATTTAETRTAGVQPSPGLNLKAGDFDPAGPIPGPEAPQLVKGQRGLYVVQFKDVITADSRQALASVGAEVDTYLPDYSFLVRISTDQAKALSANSLVRAVTRFRPAWKAPDLGSSGSGTVRIHTFHGDEQAVSDLVRKLGGQVKQAADGAVLATIARSAAAGLARSENVTFIEEVRPFELTNDTAAGLLRMSTAGGPWTNGLTGTGQVVGIADTGLDTGNSATLNPDLANRLQVTPIALGRPDDWSDPDGHGTHTAGSIAGDGSVGGPIKGMAPGAKMVFQSVLDANGGLGGIPADLGALFAQASTHGATIHSNSWGVPVTSGGWIYDTFAQQVDQYTWNNKGFLPLFAAGNGGQAPSGNTRYNSITTPGTAKNAITVGASENDRPSLGSDADNPATIARFSSRGNTPDGRLKPDLVAPGTWVLSTRSTIAPDGNYWGTYDTYHAYDSGTSMATPMVAGAAAVVRQYYTDLKGVSPSASLIKATLINGAQDLGYGWKSRDQGWGRIDLENSLFPASGRQSWFENEVNSLATNETRTYSFNVSSGQILKFSLVWTDYPGGVQAYREIVNDLDLQVVAPDGKVYRGNCFSGNTASTMCGADHVNNVENVYFASPVAGTYIVKVSGFNVPSGPQPYSLVFAGNGLAQASIDTQPPTVSITSPSTGSTISGTTMVTASATDNVGVTSVEFYLNGALKSTVTSSPYTWSWNTANSANGSHTLMAKAYDASGNAGTTSASVTVANASSTATVNETFTGSLVSSGGYKTYYIDVTAPGTISLNLSWPTSSSDLDLYLYSPTGAQASASATLTNPETISFSATTAGRYSIRVQSYSGGSTYTLTASHPIDTGATAPFGQGGSLPQGGMQLYQLTAGSAGSINLKLSFPPGTDFDLYLINASGSTVATANSTNLNPETISYAVSGPGTYTIRVKAYSGGGAFTLTGYYPK